MPHAKHSQSKSVYQQFTLFACMTVGTFLVAIALRAFFIPHSLIDGGTLGIALICGHLFGESTIPVFLILLNAPFLFWAFKEIGKGFVIQMIVATLFFAIFFIAMVDIPHFQGDFLEVIVSGGLILGVGVGLIIRAGGCLDGTEIMAIITSKRTGFTVGQTILGVNVFIFAMAGLVLNDWHAALRSLMAYFIAVKIMDTVIVGLDETKSVMIVSSEPKEIADALMHELGLALTFMHGRGGFSGDSREIIYTIVERLQLAKLKSLVLEKDPAAFIAIENLHEVVSAKPKGHKQKPGHEPPFHEE